MGSRNNVEEEEREKEGEEAVAARKLANVFLFWKNVYINWLDQSNKVFFFCSFSLSLSPSYFYFGKRKWHSECLPKLLSQSSTRIIQVSIDIHIIFLLIAFRTLCLCVFCVPSYVHFNSRRLDFSFLLKGARGKFDLIFEYLNFHPVLFHLRLKWAELVQLILFFLRSYFSFSRCVCVYFFASISALGICSRQRKSVSLNLNAFWIF